MQNELTNQALPNTTNTSTKITTTTSTKKRKFSEKLEELEPLDDTVYFSRAAHLKGLQKLSEDLLVAIDKFSLESYPYSESLFDKEEMIKQMESLKDFIDEKGAYWDDLARLDLEFLNRRLNDFESRTELKESLQNSALFTIGILLKEYAKEQLRPLLKRRKVRKSNDEENDK